MTPSPFHGIFSAFNQEHASTPTGTLPMSITLEEPTKEEESSTAATSSQQTGQIAVDIYELENYYIIRAPIAGVRLADLDIQVDNKVVTIRGQRMLPEEVSEDKYYIQECFWGEFSRSITMPTAVDPKKIKATFSKDSILKIIIPKEEKVKIIRINETN